MSEEQKPCVNHDKVIWRKPTTLKQGDFDIFQPAIFVTLDGNIGIDIGGRVIVHSIENWHKAGKKFLTDIQQEKGKEYASFTSSRTNEWCLRLQQELLNKQVNNLMENLKLQPRKAVFDEKSESCRKIMEKRNSTRAKVLFHELSGGKVQIDSLKNFMSEGEIENKYGSSIAMEYRLGCPKMRKLPSGGGVEIAPQIGEINICVTEGFYSRAEFTHIIVLMKSCGARLSKIIKEHREKTPSKHLTKTIEI